MKGKNLREQMKPKYIINEKHAGNTYTYTYIIHKHLDTYTYSYVPHSGSCLEMNRKKKYIYINKHMLYTYIHTHSTQIYAY